MATSFIDAAPVSSDDEVSRDEIPSEDRVSLEKKAKDLGVDPLLQPVFDINRTILTFITEDVARRYRMVAFAFDGKSYSIAMVHPQDIEALNVLRFLAQDKQVEIRIFVSLEYIVEKMIGQYTGTEKALSEAILSFEHNDTLEKKAKKVKEEKTQTMTWEVLQDAPIAKLVQVILKHAVDGRASDVHVEPIDQKYRVRYRLDGVLHASLVLPMDVGRAVVARVKILSNLKIDEKRKPQDGRFRFSEGDVEVDLRVSTFPVVDGEKVVMRLLDKSKGMGDLSTLGLTGRNYEVLLRKIREPYGIALLTGPTGSGKSTSLYAFLMILNQENRNIVTLEDPVEYSLDGINQSQVKPEIGYTFASGLRSILRQDPNVIMVGEIRDNETAELAIHAALTGHLVFSTLHTNSAIGAIPRLKDMGVEPFLMASSLQVVAAQRLVRRICSHCKEKESIVGRVIEKVKKVLEGVSFEEAKKYGVDLNVPLEFFHGKGCLDCNKTGYEGRVAIHEVFEITPKVQKIISGKIDFEVEIGKEAEKQGMVTLKQDGLLKALAGLTTLAEIERVTEGTIMVDEE
jgi:type IV pilus assembly protein PilB